MDPLFLFFFSGSNLVDGFLFPLSFIIRRESRLKRREKRKEEEGEEVKQVKLDTHDPRSLPRSVTQSLPPPPSPLFPSLFPPFLSSLSNCLPDGKGKKKEDWVRKRGVCSKGRRKKEKEEEKLSLPSVFRVC